MKHDHVEVWGIPTCGTTRKALKYLSDNGVPYVFKNSRETAPTKTLLREAASAVDHPKRLFNTSGGSYREGGWKERADSMTRDEVIEALLQDPMLIKRPIARNAKGIVVGFDEMKLKEIL